MDFNRVRLLLAQYCPHDPEEITMDKHLVNDLEFDSFGIMDLVIAFENEFSIEISDRDLRLFGTVEDVVNYIERRAMGAMPQVQI